jgi:hypothetical protein
MREVGARPRRHRIRTTTYQLSSQQRRTTHHSHQGPYCTFDTGPMIPKDSDQACLRSDRWDLHVRRIVRHDGLDFFKAFSEEPIELPG